MTTTSTEPSVRERLAIPVLMATDDLDEERARLHLASQVHSGDCTDDAWACARCRADAALRVVEAQLDQLQEPSEGMQKAAKKGLPFGMHICDAWPLVIQHIRDGGS
jgi:hypothetical protein